MKRKTKKLIYNITVSLLLLGGIIWVSARFVHLGNVEYTDNAQVKQLIVPVNSRVQGFIQKIYFDEYQQVRKGDRGCRIQAKAGTGGSRLPECPVRTGGTKLDDQHHSKQYFRIGRRDPGS